MVRVSPQLTYNERKTLPNLPENVALRYELELVGLSDAWDPSIYGDWFSTPKDPA